MDEEKKFFPFTSRIVLGTNKKIPSTKWADSFKHHEKLFFIQTYQVSQFPYSRE
jgi:hypothetical protein